MVRGCLGCVTCALRAGVLGERDGCELRLVSWNDGKSVFWFVYIWAVTLGHFSNSISRRLGSHSRLDPTSCPLPSCPYTVIYTTRLDNGDKKRRPLPPAPRPLLGPAVGLSRHIRELELLQRGPALQDGPMGQGTQRGEFNPGVHLGLMLRCGEDVVGRVECGDAVRGGAGRAERAPVGG